MVLGLALTKEAESLVPLPFGHVSWPTPKEADAVFLWTGALNIHEMFLAGQVALLYKPVYWASGRGNLPDFLQQGLRIIKNSAATTPRGGYETLMGDLDVTLPPKERWEWIVAAEAGKCAGCGSIYEKFGHIARVEKAGGKFFFHRDCYDRMRDPETVNAAIITDRMVEALRKDNARLQHELEAFKKEGHADDRVRLRGSRAGRR